MTRVLLFESCGRAVLTCIVCVCMSCTQDNLVAWCKLHNRGGIILLSDTELLKVKFKLCHGFNSIGFYFIMDSLINSHKLISK